MRETVNLRNTQRENTTRRWLQGLGRCIHLANHVSHTQQFSGCWERMCGISPSEPPKETAPATPGSWTSAWHRPTMTTIFFFLKPWLENWQSRIKTWLIFYERQDSCWYFFCLFDWNIMTLMISYPQKIKKVSNFKNIPVTIDMTLFMIIKLAIC